MELEHSLTPYTKINSKWIKDLPIRSDAIKLLEENIAEHSDINCSNMFWDLSPKTKEIKAKINKWDLIKLKRFCKVKETIDKTKRQHTEWEKVYTSDMTDKGLIANIYKQLIKLNIKEQTFKNAPKNRIDIFPKRNCRWATGT